MKKGVFWRSPGQRACIAIGATIGIGHALFRGVGEAWGPIPAVLITPLACATLAFGINLFLQSMEREKAAADERSS